VCVVPSVTSPPGPTTSTGIFDTAEPRIHTQSAEGNLMTSFRLLGDLEKQFGADASALQHVTLTIKSDHLSLENVE
jgi:hypothetical protein